MTKDYYKILGLDKRASKDEIKKAFRKLAHKYHPDKKGGDEQKFKEVNEAYQVLSNDKKRAEYDAYGQTFNSGGRGHQHAGFDFSGFQGAGQAGFDFDDLGDIFSDFFGGGSRRGGRQQRGRDISTEIDLSFEDAVFGAKRTILITKTSFCDTCNGTGAKQGTEMKACGTCNGQGQVHETKQSIFGTISSVQVCNTCRGSGEVPKEVCETCKGNGVLKKEEEVNVQIPAGVENGEMVRLAGMGEAVKGGVAGDLYIKLNVQPHAVFKRDGNDLRMDLQVKLTDALLGSEYTIETLDGPITLKVPQGTSHGEILRIKGKGVPFQSGSSKRGDVLVRIIIQFPAKLSKKAKELVSKLQGEGV